MAKSTGVLLQALQQIPYEVDIFKPHVFVACFGLHGYYLNAGPGIQVLSPFFRY